jgi:hypothetical protein
MADTPNNLAVLARAGADSLVLKPSLDIARQPNHDHLGFLLSGHSNTVYYITVILLYHRDITTVNWGRCVC